jgi:hypothetical protein
LDGLSTQYFMLLSLNFKTTNSSGSQLLMGLDFESHTLTGIKPHRDREFFGELVLGISLLEPVVMDFKCIRTHEVRALLLEPRSVLVMQGEARWLWQHSITSAPNLLYRGKHLPRGRRTSLTFRTIQDESVIA